MAEHKSNEIRDGKGAQIRVPIFVSQDDMDLIEKGFFVQDGYVINDTSLKFEFGNGVILP